VTAKEHRAVALRNANDEYDQWEHQAKLAAKARRAARKAKHKPKHAKQ
jgi:hypothetical protein